MFWNTAFQSRDVKAVFLSVRRKPYIEKRWKVQTSIPFSSKDDGDNIAVVPYGGLEIELYMAEAHVHAACFWYIGANCLHS